MFFIFEDTSSVGYFGPLAVLPTSCTVGAPKHITSMRYYVHWHIGEKKKGRLYHVCRSHGLHYSVSSSLWRGSWRDTQPNKVCRHAFSGAGDIGQYSHCSQECHTQVKQKSTCWFNMPPLGTLLWWEGKRTTWLSSAMPTQQDGAVQFVQWNQSQTLTQRCFGRWTGSSESGLTFSNVDLVCVCVCVCDLVFVFKNNIYNISAFKCTHLIAKLQSLTHS